MSIKHRQKQHLPYDIARCSGTDAALCRMCRRREPGNIQWQGYIAPAYDDVTGCEHLIETEGEQ